MRHFHCSACRQDWEFEESTTQAMGGQLVCPICNAALTENKAATREASDNGLADQFCGAPAMDNPFAALGRTGLWAFIVWWSIPLFTLPMRGLNTHYIFLDRVNLIFHEAGHWIFGVFGNHLLMSFGGTLGQLLMPAILAGAFFIKNRDCFATGLGVWWFGESLVDCAPYINDARALQLQLLGGGTGKEVHGHDWEYILGELGLINQDIYIARGVLLAGRIVMALGLAWMAAVIARQALLISASGTRRS